MALEKAQTSHATPADSQLPSGTLAWFSFGGVVGAAVVGGWIFVWTDPQLHLDPDGFAVFAPIYIAAQAVERLLEPIASRYMTAAQEKSACKSAREDKLKAQHALTAARAAGRDASVPLNELTAAAEGERMAERALQKKREQRKLIFFLVASVVSCVLAGVLGLGLYEAMSTEPLEEYLGAIDVALTGLVIGAGTKPLHDLIARLEKSKENADPADKPTAQVTGAITGPPVGP